MRTTPSSPGSIQIGEQVLVTAGDHKDFIGRASFHFGQDGTDLVYVEADGLGEWVEAGHLTPSAEIAEN